MGPTNFSRTAIPSRNKNSTSELRRSLIPLMRFLSIRESRRTSTIKPRIRGEKVIQENGIYVLIPEVMTSSAAVAARSGVRVRKQ